MQCEREFINSKLKQMHKHDAKSHKIKNKPVTCLLLN